MNKLHNKDYSIAFKRGTDTNRAKFKKEAVQGEVYFATDTGGFYIAESSAGASEATLSAFSPVPSYNATENLQSGEVGSGGATTIDISNASSVIQGGAWSVGAWVHSTDSSGTNQAIISSGSGSSNEMLLSYNGSTGEFRGTSRATSSTNEVVSTSGLGVDQWHHVALTFDGTNSLKLYINGALDSSGTGEVLTSTGVSNFRIGNSAHGTGFLAGFIDQVFMFDRELTAAEIANIYNTKIITGPSALYRFNGNANDETGNYNGTATNLGFSGSEFPYTSVSSNGTYILPSSRNKSGSEQAFRLGTSYSIGNQFSMSFWVQFHNLSTYQSGDKIHIFGSGGYNNATNSNSRVQSYISVGSSGQLKINVEINNFSTDTTFVTSPNSSTWYHFAIGIEGKSPIIYINSIMELQQANGFTDGLGWINTNSNLNGDEELDPGLGFPPIGYSIEKRARCADVAIFDYKLTATQVANIYNNREYVNPLAIWRLDGNRDDETGTHSVTNGGNFSTVVPY